MALPTITLISPDDSISSYNTGISLTAQYDDADLANSSVFLFEVDISASFNSPRRQYQDFALLQQERKRLSLQAHL